jgi:hypothetical protein
MRKEMSFNPCEGIHTTVKVHFHSMEIESSGYGKKLLSYGNSTITLWK